MNQAEYAARHNVSRKTVTMWKARGWLVFDGKQVDVEASDANLKRYRAAGVTAVPAVASNGNTSMKSGPDTPAAAAERILTASGAAWDLEEAKRIKENYLALLNQLEYEEKSGSLVALDIAESVLFTRAREFRDAVLNWPAKAAPLIAADLGMEADKVTEILTAHVHTFIAGLSEPKGDFKD